MQRADAEWPPRVGDLVYVIETGDLGEVMGILANVKTNGDQVVGKQEGGLTKTLAYVVLKSGHAGDAALAESLKAFVKDQLAPYKYPREIRFLTELPKTATGKIQRFKLREAAAR